MKIKKQMKYRGGGIKRERNKKICMITCIILNLSILFFFKYFDFAVGFLNKIVSYFEIKRININLEVLLPVGISFYILQALGYLIDVYRGDIYAERNFFRYALFVSFFPQLVAGPIERSENLLKQLKEQHKFEFGNLKKGVLMILYGLFLKMVIADRTAVFVNTVFGNTAVYTGVYIIVATLLFSIQIYCDFYGYSIIARGSALIMGIHLMENFSAPYYSKSIKEFWRRWHISLSGWFRDYLYIPLGGNRKGLVKKERNLMFVFIVSGLWHGASLGFAFWGFLHGFYQIAADIIRGSKKLLIETWNKHMPGFLQYQGGLRKIRTFSMRLFRQICTCFFVGFAWLFFRSGSLSVSVQILKRMLSVNNWTILVDGSLFELGVSCTYMHILLLSVIVLFFVDSYKYKGYDVAAMVLRQGWIFQTLMIFALVFVILLFGYYGKLYDVQQFIYFQF